MRFLITLAVVQILAAEERWYESRLGGEPAGFNHSKFEPAENGGFFITEEMRFVMNRLGSRIEVRSVSRTLDDANGQFVSMDGETSSSQQTSTYKARLTSSGIEITTGAGGKSYARTVPMTDAVLSSRGVMLLCRARMKQVRDSATYSQFMHDFGGVAQFTRILIAKESLVKVEETNNLIPGKREIWFDPEFHMVKAEFDLPFGKVSMRQADRESAMRATSGANLQPETYERTLAKSNIRLPDPRSIERIKLKLTHRRPELGWPAFDSLNQRIIEQTKDGVVLEVWRPSRRASKTAMDARLFLAPNAVLQSDDAEVIRLARSVVTGTPSDPLQRARKLQDWVARNLKLDLGIALAPASEVARNRGGTCIAYSVLLSSLQRAVGIPSRVAMGYVYTNGIWGGHAWTEALVDGQWLPLDAAAYAPGIADAARFQFGSYTLEDNLAAATAEAAKMYGNIDVAVVEYTLGNRTVRVPADAKPYVVSSDRYENPWLGISFRLPESFQFIKLDAIYPDATIAGAEKDQTRITVSLEPIQRLTAITAAGSVKKTSLGGKAALSVYSALKQRVVMADGNSLWVITAEGDDGGRVLEATARSWKWIPER